MHGAGPQDKLEQKRHFQAAGVPVADFMGVEDAAAAQRAAQAYGFPFFLKSRRCAPDTLNPQNPNCSRPTHCRHPVLPCASDALACRRQPFWQMMAEPGCACLIRLAYDGRGNALVRGPAELEAAAARLGGYEHGLYAERWAPFVKVGPPT